MQNRGEGAPAGTSRSLARSPDTHASDPVLVHWLAFLLHASFRPRLTATPLRFAITSPLSGCEEDFHLQAVDHARRTKEKGGPQGPPWETKNKTTSLETAAKLLLLVLR